MQLRCPHCRSPIEVVDDDLASERTCPSCGSSFSLVNPSLAPTAAIQPGRQRLGHFELLSRLGMGSFGTVWQARDTELDRLVAIKIPRNDQIAGAELEQFLREARAAAQLRHPNIVSVHEVGRENDTVYIVSDLVEGLPLSDWLSGQQPTFREAAELCRTLADTLHYAHEKGVVHRDVKPGNIMLDVKGQPHVMDFGLAKRDAGEVTVTMDGKILGTPAYMSPEQARGEGSLADRRCDIYSIGVILFQMLTGELPFRGTTRMLLHQLLYEEPKSPRAFNDRMPKDLETICLKCLQKEPQKRYQTSADLRDDLERYLKHEPILARPIGRMERAWRWCRRNQTIAGLTAAIAVSIIVGVSLSTYFAVEARRRARQAQEVTTIAVSTLETMIKDVQHSLRAIPEAREIRRELLRKSLADLERVSGEMQSQKQADRNTARALVDLGELFREAGDDAGLNANRTAEANLRRAVDIYRQLSADNPTDRQLRQEYSTALNALGNSYLSDNRLPAAKESLFTGLELARASMNDGTNDAAYAVAFSWILTNCGDWHAIQARFREALPYFLEAEEVVAKLIATDPDNRGYRERLAECILKIGDVYHDLRENDKALEQFNRVLAISEEQYRQFPESSLALDAMSFIYERLGNHWLQVGDPEQARGMYEKMLEFIELAIVQDPKNRDLQEGLAVGYGKIATVSMKLGNRQAAEAARRKAAEIRQGLAQTSE